MNSILLSIHKNYSDKIFSGQKKFEYRRVIPKSRISRIMVYEARGCGKIVGELIIDNIVSGSISEIWESTSYAGGVTYHDFVNYFQGKNKVFAYSISKVKIYDKPKSLADFGLSKAPQNFVWIERD